MPTIRKIIIKAPIEGVYLFQIMDSGEKGIFIPGKFEIKKKTKIELVINNFKGRSKSSFSGQVSWVNREEDQGVGVVFSVIKEEAFRELIQFLGTVAYI